MQKFVNPLTIQLLENIVNFLNEDDGIMYIESNGIVCTVYLRAYLDMSYSIYFMDEFAI